MVLGAMIAAVASGRLHGKTGAHCTGNVVNRHRRSVKQVGLRCADGMCGEAGGGRGKVAGDWCRHRVTATC